MATEAPSDRLIELCTRLAGATGAGAVEWRREGEDEYVWERPEGIVAIAARDRDGQPPYELAIYNGSHEQVEELESALVDDDQPAPWNGPLAELYRLARRSALRADDIIEALVAAIPAGREAGAGARSE